MIKNGTWKSEPANEDGWYDDEVSEPESFDNLFRYAEEHGTFTIKKTSQLLADISPFKLQARPIQISK